MSQNLALEYTCTAAEMEEAESLSLRRQLGGGSKWRTWLVLLVMLVGLLLVLYFELRREVPAAYIPCIFVTIFLFALVSVLWKRKVRHRQSVANKVEVSNDGLVAAIGGVKLASPWSAFSDCIESPNLFVLVDRPKALLMVLPKRAFPSESWLTWFRNLANNRPRPAEQAQTPRAPLLHSADVLIVRFRLGFRDYLDRAVASWFTWSMILGVAGMILGISIREGAHPSPRAVFSATQIYFMFMLPATLLIAVMIIFIAAIHPWWSHTEHLVPQEMAFSNESIAAASADGSGVLSWTTYSSYKETRWSFILWRGWGRFWMLVPKRAFGSADELERCRALLAARLRRSPWFFG